MADDTGLVAPHLVSIDPGLRGAVAIFDADGNPLELHDMPVLKSGATGKDEIDVNGLVAILPPGVQVVLEAQQAMPKQGVASTFKTGLGFGKLLGMLDALAFPYKVVQPRAWAKAVGKPARSDKEWNIGEARRRWPAFAPQLLKSKDGRADVLLIGAAEFAQPAPAPKPRAKPAKKPAPAPKKDVAPEIPDW